MTTSSEVNTALQLLHFAAEDEDVDDDVGVKDENPLIFPLSNSLPLLPFMKFSVAIQVQFQSH